jgi:hypothetical protein
MRRQAGLAAAKANPGEPGRWPSCRAQGMLKGRSAACWSRSEAYPDLKASQNMMQLTEELTSTENKVAFARQAYNDSVMTYNNRREVFPASIVAGNVRVQAGGAAGDPGRGARGGARSAEGRVLRGGFRQGEQVPEPVLR